MKQIIKVKNTGEYKYIPQIIEKGDWIDLRLSESVELDPGDGIIYLPLGVAMKLPAGYEAHAVSRSCTPKKFGIFNPGALGVIDNSYSGNSDEWKFPALALRPTTIDQGTRIAQFRIVLSQKATMWQRIKHLFYSGVKIVMVDSLDSEDRGGLGSTGEK